MALQPCLIGSFGPSVAMIMLFGGSKDLIMLSSVIALVWDFVGKIDEDTKAVGRKFIFDTPCPFAQQTGLMVAKYRNSNVWVNALIFRFCYYLLK